MRLVISVYMDIIVRCTAAMTTQLIDEMRNFIEKEAVSKTWCYDIGSPALKQHAEFPY